MTIGSSVASCTTVTPRAWVASTASTGISSMSRGTRSPSITVPSSSAVLTSRSATGSPAMSRRWVFATRAPRRPNPIGLSIVELEGIEGRVLHVDGVDMLDGTPLLDIKPFVPAFDAPEVTRTGWLEEAEEKARKKRSDGRFA